MTSPLYDTNGQPLTIYRGTSLAYTINVADADTGGPKNLEGATECTVTISARPQASTRDLVLTYGNGVSHNGTGGTITFIPSKEQTEALPLGKRMAEVWVTDIEGRRDLFTGPCYVIDTADLPAITP
jgi:hypothetical protein